MITLSHISKSFRVAKRDPGLSGAVRSLFHREYRTVEALRDMPFHIGEGELIGCIGPNGAGKSTAIKIMSGILVPDGGECTICGHVPWRDRKRYVQNLGVVFGQRTQLWWDVPIRDSFELLRDIYRVEQPKYEYNLKRCVEQLELGSLLDTPLRQLSLGQRMRCELAGSLLHSPRLLFLDEPTIGLDAVSKRAVRSFIREINVNEGVTVILTTHDTADLEALTERVLLLGKGQLLYDGALDGLRDEEDSSRTLTVRFPGMQEPVIPEGCVLKEWHEGTGVLKTDAAAVSAAIAKLSAVLPLTDVTVEGSPIDDVIARMYKRMGVRA